MAPEVDLKGWSAHARRMLEILAEAEALARPSHRSGTTRFNAREALYLTAAAARVRTLVQYESLPHVANPTRQSGWQE